ncbi:metal ABC transporter ATP-binding protein [Nocardia australiensis]|uniref:metal ABC transporter ATP-binding protein n=1 Tax=Nocardia australiensis TaxID=2887191 RepID=UPI001D15B5C7|nr:ATP-binding cassette domain-containing protein [Nocardia australiensis]
MGDHGTIVEADQVSYRYGARRALSEVSFTITSGTLVSLVGGNGSGKSTLLALIAGVLAPDTGSLTCRSSARPAIAFQRSMNADELPLTVRECVTLGRFGPQRLLHRLTGADRRIVDESIERLEIGHLAGKQLRDLSGGQRQRTLLAQALVQQSDLLLLDEPTAALDAEGQRVVDELLREQTNAGTTIIQATHRAQDTVNSDRVLELSEGRLVKSPLNKRM